MDIFTLKDGREIKIDWEDMDSVLAVSRPDMKEVKEQLDEWLEIACSHLSGEDVYALLRKGGILKNKRFK